MRRIFTSIDTHLIYVKSSDRKFGHKLEDCKVSEEADRFAGNEVVVIDVSALGSLFCECKKFCDLLQMSLRAK